ncbi:MAG: bifunctional DNA-formamidopyrimidine glycosylase/DNA-(apurinic or apyrimidinic site) lyase [Hyphomicrobiales bacterium]|nr:bifunctional DNA-formamidopyrimidine glycosylase/DNA-(apurinic or apyrimidinic site) lyase [Hyphomicrobiales bacterium]MDE2114098.1 bifunctional DNA-formamidopyrimidine glycosylase/DNA-(apurinic or apyrimidinic site) lyase [Hyphomicrobiales bacterium]
MPELPEVETVRRGLLPALEGQTFERVEQRRLDLRFALPERFDARLQGRRVMQLSRRAKYLLAHLDDDMVLLMHLGMSGSFRIEDRFVGEFHHPRSNAPNHDHIVFHMVGGKTITYNDPRRFGFMDLVGSRDLASHKFMAQIGLEPLSGALDGARLLSLFAARKAPLKAALLDQRLIAGLGNIYVCEALHRARLSPLRAAGSLKKGEADRLASRIVEVLGEAIEVGGSTLRDHRQTDGALGYFQHSFRVYDKEGSACPTPGCAGVIQRIVQSGRSTFYCATCQG